LDGDIEMTTNEEIERCKKHLTDPSLNEKEKKGAVVGLNDWFMQSLFDEGLMERGEDEERGI